MQDLRMIALEKVANQFNRVEDPVIDQDSAKLLGAAGGLYGGYKIDPVMKRKGLLSKMIGGAASPVMRPVKMLAGMGLGALGAGLGARYLNKENKEDHEEALAKSYAQAANPYGGMQSYAAEKVAQALSKAAAPRDYLPTTEEAVDQTLKGGTLGALAAALLGTKVGRGAGIGALGNVAYNAYKKGDKADNAQVEQPFAQYPYQYGDLGKMAAEVIEKNAKYGAKKILAAFGGAKDATKASKKVISSSKLPSVEDALKRTAKKDNKNLGGYSSKLDYELRTGM